MKCVRRLDHVGINFQDLESATEFFLDLGLERVGAMSIQGEPVDNILGLQDVRTDVVWVRTPDGSGTLELIKFHTPADNEGPHASAANRLGLRHISFEVDDVNGIVDTLRGKGIRTVGKVQDYGGYRLCYVHGPEGIIVELAEQIGSAPAR